MKNIMWVGGLLAFALSAGQTARACDECQLRKEGTYLGQFTLLGNGTVRSWVKYEKGKPTSLGVTFSETALSGLKEAKDLPPQMPMMAYRIALPPEAKATGFDHIVLDWNPIGHIPQGIYTVPHFDFHFYTITDAMRNKITAVGKDIAICEKKPEARFLPAGYIIPPDTAVPQMGAHAVDAATPELHGQPFTQTFIYGYYNGQMNFVEPMVALDYLKTRPNFSTAVKVPQAYSKNGFFPTRYSISYDPVRQEYSVALNGLTWRKAAPANKAPAKAKVKATTKPKTKTARR
jgi:hypothetical protein